MELGIIMVGVFLVLFVLALAARAGKGPSNVRGSRYGSTSSAGFVSFDSGGGGGGWGGGDGGGGCGGGDGGGGGGGGC